MSHALLVVLVAALAAGPAWAEDSRAGGAGVRVTLQQGDRLINLAREHGVSVDAILEANGVADARDLRAGQEIVIPPAGTVAKTKVALSRPETYRVRAGDLPGGLARRFGLSVEELLEANGLDSSKSLQIGQVITIPAPGTSAKVAAAAEKRAREEVSAAAGKAGRKGGDTAEPAWMKRARETARDLGLGTTSAALKVLRGDLDPAWIRAAGSGRPPATFRFPVAGGWVGRGWGSGPGGYHLAVDMPGPMSTRVSAAAPGIVAYAGNGLAGFGKVVIVIHRGGLVSLYAHNSELKTVAGERVKQGTRVAFLGSTGISRGPHVHFEVLYDGQLCDPLPLIRPQARGKNGRPVIEKRDLRDWPRRGGPPKGLQCAKRRRHPDYVGRPYGWRPPDWPHNTGTAARAAAGDEPGDTGEAGEEDPDVDLGSEVEQEKAAP
jgi:murein DD-endopeptidase MepM/ murein hydrolase activator NlpD